MALFITFNYGPDSEFHIGQEVKTAIHEIKELQADGDELFYIRNNFKNIPMAHNRVVRWYGDHAKFIAANIRDW